LRGLRLAKFTVVNLLISNIDVGARRREKPGSLASLKSSLERVGQIHPITVRPNGRGTDLVQGMRRIRAAEALGWKKIWARVGKFTDEQLREIELDENQARLDFTRVQASAARLRRVKADAELAMSDKNVTHKKRGQKAGPAEILSGGDKKKHDALKQQMSRDKRHVAAAEKYPVLQRAEWKRGQAIDAAELLERMDPTIRGSFVTMISEPGVPPKIAMSILDNVASKPKSEQKQLAKLYDSGKPDSISLAKSRAAHVPPSPPLDLSLWTGVRIRCEKALKLTRPKYKRDATKAVAAVVQLTKMMESDFKEFQKKEKAR